ncbi:MAG TPA: DUF362 domain-containing protein [Desulfobacteraceae bacterium]|nr:DUF362 domain-containing protein [Desulfobacteraceae bacterium]
MRKEKRREPNRQGADRMIKQTALPFKLEIKKDVFINIPVLKHHAGACLTVSILVYQR